MLKIRKIFSCAGLLWLLSCQTLPDNYSQNLIEFLPADTIFYLLMNLDQNHQDFFLENIFYPILGEQDWVKTLLLHSKTVAVGLDDQFHITLILENNYSRILMLAGLRGLADLQENKKVFTNQEKKYLIDASRPDLLLFTQKKLSPEQLFQQSPAPVWPPSLDQQEEKIIAFYSPTPHNLPFIKSLPLATDTLQGFAGWVDQQQEKTILTVQLRTPTSQRAQALALNLRLLLGPMLLTSGVPSLRQQAHQIQFNLNGDRLAFHLALDQQAFALIISQLVPQWEF